MNKSIWHTTKEKPNDGVGMVVYYSKEYDEELLVGYYNTEYEEFRHWMNIIAKRKRSKNGVFLMTCWHLKPTWNTHARHWKSQKTL